MKRANLQDGLNDRKRQKSGSIYDYRVVDSEETMFDLSNMKNKVVLIENVATL